MNESPSEKVMLEIAKTLKEIRDILEYQYPAAGWHMRDLRGEEHRFHKEGVETYDPSRASR